LCGIKLSGADQAAFWWICQLRAYRLNEESVETHHLERTEHAAQPGVEFGELGGFIAFYLRITQTLSFQAFVKQAGETEKNLRAGYFAVLTLIGENPGITQTALSRANGRDKSSLTPVIDELERREFLTRRRVETNRRAYALELTPAGERARRVLLKAALRHEKNLRAILGKTDSEEMFRLLKLLSSALTKKLANGHPQP
jgi:DNA-binding MarR family transcriptional regulator